VVNLLGSGSSGTLGTLGGQDLIIPDVGLHLELQLHVLEVVFVIISDGSRLGRSLALGGALGSLGGGGTGLARSGSLRARILDHSGVAVLSKLLDMLAREERKLA
jgi:hypothetical protein